MHASYFYLYLSILIYPILLRTKEDTYISLKNFQSTERNVTF